MYKILLPAILLLFQLNLLAQNVPIQLPKGPHPPSKPALRVAAGTTEISKPGKSLTYKWSKDHYLSTSDTTYYTYDAAGRLLTSRNDTSLNRNTYNNSGVRIIQNDSIYYDGVWSKLITTYNNAGEVLQFSELSIINGAWRITGTYSYSYNSAGQDTLDTFAYYDNKSDTLKELYSRSFQYNGKGQLIQYVNHNYDNATGKDNLYAYQTHYAYDQQGRVIQQYSIGYASNKYIDTSLVTSYIYNNGILAIQTLYSGNLPWIRFTDIVWRNYNNKSTITQDDTTLVSYTLQQYYGGMWKDSVKVEKTYPDENGSYTYLEKTLVNGSYVVTKIYREIYNDHQDLTLDYEFNNYLYSVSGTSATSSLGVDSVIYHYSGIDKQSAVKWFNGATGMYLSDSTAYFDFTQYNVAAVNEKALQASVKLYPQPANNTMNVELPTAGNFSYEVKSTTGMQLTSGNIASGASIDVSSLHPGIYFIEFENAGQKIIQKFIVE